MVNVTNDRYPARAGRGDDWRSDMRKIALLILSIYGFAFLILAAIMFHGKGVSWLISWLIVLAVIAIIVIYAIALIVVMK